MFLPNGTLVLSLVMAAGIGNVYVSASEETQQETTPIYACTTSDIVSYYQSISHYVDLGATFASIGGTEKEEECDVPDCYFGFGRKCYKFDGGGVSEEEDFDLKLVLSHNLEPMYRCGNKTPPSPDYVYTFGAADKLARCNYSCYFNDQNGQCWKLDSDGQVREEEMNLDFEPMYYCSIDRPPPQEIFLRGNEKKEVECDSFCYSTAGNKCWKLESDDQVYEEKIEMKIDPPMYYCSSVEPGLSTILRYGNEKKEEECGNSCYVANNGGASRHHNKGCFKLDSDVDGVPRIERDAKVEGIEPRYYCSSTKPFAYTVIMEGDKNKEKICNSSSCSSEKKCWKFYEVRNGVPKVTETETVDGVSNLRG